MTVQNLKLRVPIRFPTAVQGSSGLSVIKSNGIFTIKFDLASLSDVVPPTSNLSHSKIPYWNDLTGETAIVSLTDIQGIINALPAPRIITTGDVTVSDTDTLIVLNKSVAAATAFTLPAVASRSPAGLALRVFDWAGTGGDMTFTPNGTEKIMGASSPWTVTSGGSAQTGGSLLLIPSTDLGGWLVQ